MKTRFSSSFKKMATPGSIPEKLAVIVSYLTIALIFIVEVMADPGVSFHFLYFPALLLIALHSTYVSPVIGALVLSLLAQFLVLFYFQPKELDRPIYYFLLIVCSNLAVTLLARYSRTNTLEANHLAITDSLTQLNNRRAIVEAIDCESRRQRRYGGQFSVAMIDLDGFKGLNDSRGHGAGDEALTLLAHILRAHTRQTDTLSRYGGDEFVVLMPNTIANNCYALCSSLSSAIANRMTEELSYPLSASIGFVTVERWGDTTQNILSAVDRAMYRAKANGKGCIAMGYSNSHKTPWLLVGNDFSPTD